MRNWLMSSLVITALTFSPNALFAPFHEASIAYAAKKEPFSRGVALRACKAEASKKSLASGFSREVALYGNASSESVQLTELLMQSRECKAKVSPLDSVGTLSGEFLNDFGDRYDSF